MARVAVDMPLAHLDRPFDYQVPESMADTAVAGCRVRVRFAGRLANGFLLERAAASEHGGRLAYLERVMSPEPVLTPEVAGLARAVADRYAGTLADVLRLAVPPRHARVEGVRVFSRAAGLSCGAPGRRGLTTAARYPGARNLVKVPDRTLLPGGHRRRTCPAGGLVSAAGPHWAGEIAVAAATAAAAAARRAHRGPRCQGPRGQVDAR